MGKRSNFHRRPNDLYPTIDPRAVAPMVDIWKRAGISTYIEPCAGDASLIDLLSEHGFKCTYACDIDPQRQGIFTRDALDLQRERLPDCDAVITNPAWTRILLHALIRHLQIIKPTWLLFDADWKHTKQAVPLLDQCSDVVSVGRLKWIPDSPHTGKDNCAWYRFDASHTGGPHFHPQQIVEAA